MSTQHACRSEFDDQELVTVFDKLFQPVQEFIKEQNKKIAKHHNQTFCYQDFARSLIFFFVQGGASLKLFINTMLNRGLLSDNLNLRAVPYSTFSDAFERFSPDLFREVFFSLLSSLQLKSIPELAAFGTLYCIDGSLFPVISSMMWAEYTSNKQALRLHLCFELNRMIAVDFIIGSGKSSERKALREMIKTGITYIADRGYMCFDLFSHIVSVSAHFIFRVKSNMVYSVLEPLVVDLPKTVRALFKNVTDSRIQYTNDPNKKIYRLVCFEISKNIFCLLTDRFDLTTFQIIMLYAYRWQIELFFRFLKRTINGIHLIKNTHDGVTIQFYALLITALLELNLKQKIIKEAEDNQKSNTIICLDCELEIKPECEVNRETDIGTEIEINIETGNELMRDCELEIKPECEVNRETDIGTDIETGNELRRNEQKKPETPISDVDKFFEMIGGNMNKYWKISIHWLSALRSMISNVFDARVISVLSTL